MTDTISALFPEMDFFYKKLGEFCKMLCTKVVMSLKVR